MLTVHNFHFIIYKYVYPEPKKKKKKVVSAEICIEFYI